MSAVVVMMLTCHMLHTTLLAQVEALFASLDRNFTFTFLPYAIFTQCKTSPDPRWQRLSLVLQVGFLTEDAV